MAKEKISQSFSQFTRDICASLIKLKIVPKELEDLVDKFMLILDFKDRSWQAFKDLAKNFTSIKVSMSSNDPETLKEENIEILLPLWKNYQHLYTQISKIHKGAGIMLSWITAVFEYKLKIETLKSSRRKFPDLQKQVKSQLDIIAEINATTHLLESEKKERTAEEKKTNETKHSHLDSSIGFDRSERSNYNFPPPRPEDRETFVTNFDFRVNINTTPSRETQRESSRINLGTSNNELNVTPYFVDTQQLSDFRRKSVNNDKVIFEDFENEVNNDASQFNEIQINRNDMRVISLNEAKKPTPKGTTTFGNYQNMSMTHASKESNIILNNVRAGPKVEFMETMVDEIQKDKTDNKLQDEFKTLQKEIQLDMKLMTPSRNKQSFLIGLRNGGVESSDESLETQKLEKTHACCKKGSLNIFFC